MREEELVAEMTEGHGPSEVRRFVLGAVSAFAPLR
jgi:hypothetical protein